MMKRTVKLSTLQELAHLHHKYAKTGGYNLFSAMYNAANALSEQAFGHSYHWDDFTTICEIVCGISPMKKNGTITDIIGILQLLGIEVVDDGEKDMNKSNV